MPQFHELVYGLSGNLVLSTTASAMSAIFREHVLAALDLGPKQQDILRAHREIAEAIIDRDDEAAFTLAREHQRDIKDYCEERIPDLLDRTIHWH
jgi:DNA-binding FadR family transcriptional regulator